MDGKDVEDAAKVDGERATRELEADRVSVLERDAAV